MGEIVCIRQTSLLKSEKVGVFDNNDLCPIILLYIDGICRLTDVTLIV